MYLTGRERQLIDYLLAQKGPIPIRELAENLDVSERTVHRDINQLLTTLENYGVTIQKQSGIGISLSGSPEQKEQLKASLLQQTHTDFTPDERKVMILITLLEANEPIKLMAMATNVDVTIATISHDLDTIAPFLEKFDLQLIRRRGYGVKIEGSEANKRAAISALISDYVDESDLLMLLRENIERKSQTVTDTISNRLLGLVDQNKLHAIEQTIDRVKHEIPYQLADSAYIGLVVHLTLAIERVQKGENIDFDTDYLTELKQSEEFAIAETILEELEQVFQMKIPRAEVGFITMHLLGAKLRKDHTPFLEENMLNIGVQTKELMAYVSESMRMNVTQDKQMLYDLVAHLKPAMYRLKQNMPIKNPLLANIKQDYPTLFHVLDEGVKQVFPNIRFPEEEVGYLVLHFASAMLRVEEDVSVHALVICSSGIGTSKILASQISQHIPEIQSVDHTSLFAMENQALNHYDIFVSTVPIEHFKEDYILASPFLTDADIYEIRKQVRQKKMQVGLSQNPSFSSQKIETVNKEERMNQIKKIEQYAKVIYTIVKGFKLEKLTKTPSKESMLYDICEKLSTREIVRHVQALYQQLLDRAEIGGLAIPNTNMALFHARSEHVLEPSFTIHVLDVPMPLEGMDQTVINVENVLLMLSPKSLSEEGLEVLSHISELLIRDENHRLIFQSKDAEQIHQLLIQRLDQFLTSK
ncbi:transcriptional antiterminator BglG [Gracilibacillus halophilus YIM-C55.5]|uniref:Transcriptional antiterminator BglG n=1 Tax=Gracilibacillus halophilus YIM-C55.5 TaxID=1308866 RepID=N4WFX2_9BACI|nr:BglG family transcription antiterminator [Gracilibacillus halophilus]ENH98169.1 transcriptional antiterminator BglG [Gracilibacillus halophilus YIM-C55.5]